MKSLMEEASSIFKAIETAWNRAGKPQEFSIKILEHPEKSFFGLNTVKSAKIAILFNEHAHKQPIKSHQPSARPSTSETVEKEQSYARKPHHQSRQRTEQVGTSPEPREQRSAHSRPERTQEPREQRFEQRTESPRQERPERVEQPRQEPRPEYQSSPSEGRYDNRRRDGYERRDNRRDGRRDGRRDFRNDRRGDRQQDYGDPNATWSPEMIQAAIEWLRETLVMVGQPENTFTTNTNKNYLNITFVSPISTDTLQEELLLKSWSSLLMDAVRQKFDGTTRGLRVGLHRK
jgi:hypothetical protein